MACRSGCSCFFFFLFFFIVSLIHRFHAQTVSLPKTFLLPVTKDASSLQYLAKIRPGGDPPRPLTLVLDLGGPQLWTSHAPPTRLRVPLRSVECLSAANSGDERTRRGSTCVVISGNVVTGLAAPSELSEGAVTVESSHAASIPAVHKLLFALSPEYLLSGLASGASGMLGLGRARTALPNQLAAASGGDRRFFLCLSESDGVIAVGGDWPYFSSPSSGADVSKSMVYAPLLTAEPGSSGEYSVKLRSIEVNGERLTLNSSSMQLSTVVPYTTMESSIYRAFTGAFAKAAAAMNITRAAVPAATPFELCFSAGSVRTTPTGPAVPEIDLVLQSEMVRWKVHGRNSMVRANDDVMCLGILNGGPEQKHGVVLGGHQLEDVLMEFDLGASVVGFSRSLLMSQTRCKDFS
ncbi:probable aspartic proteinase GIP2 [Punica granatum]|uniref:Peptidase A1 domain-containing protein n=2 Tax=Punica granatum TaxID=22663 RepID=A0A218WB29_PUNGR|nr:probable aspartic proteinase GIP2 [Punica granatum]OWM69846.1 hypothetical protein CDL15_Pgr025695 [Punica granatum]PKI64918.1 hypothetical protein CRG98_014714 [Punica granatum]